MPKPPDPPPKTTLKILLVGNLEDEALRLGDLLRHNSQQADMRRVDLRYSGLRHADLRQADLCSADLVGAKLTGANLTSARYDHLTRWPAGFGNPIDSGTRRIGRNSNLSGASLAGAHLHGDLTGINLEGADLHGAEVDVCLRGANLRGAARAVPSVLYVRARLQRLHGKTASTLHVTVAHAAALALVSLLVRVRLAPALAALAFFVLLLRAVLGLSARRDGGSAKRVGITEVIYGAATVLAVAAGHIG